MTTTDARKNDFQLFIGFDENFNAFGQLFLDDGESLNTYENKNFSFIEFDMKLVQNGYTLTSRLIASKYEVISMSLLKV